MSWLLVPAAFLSALSVVVCVIWVEALRFTAAAEEQGKPFYSRMTFVIFMILVAVEALSLTAAYNA